MLLKGNIGQDAWWNNIENTGTPVIQNKGDKCIVTFYWRDPEGNEESSSISAVYIEVNCITDHHKLAPESLKRVVGTDVWYWQTEFSADWHGTYQFIPITSDYLPQSINENSKDHNIHKIKLNHRQWWRSILHFSIADPLNILSPKYCIWGQSRSHLYLPNAEYHNIWKIWDASETAQTLPYKNNRSLLASLQWKSQLLGNERTVWVFETQNSHSDLQGDKPLVLLLDGEIWTEYMPIFSALQQLTEESKLAPAFYVFVNNTSPSNRQVDFGCNHLFWQAIKDELLLDVNQRFNHRVSLKKRAVVGQSLGGLAAMYAGLSGLGMFSHVLCQSGSFWWPDSSLMSQWMKADKSVKEDGWLTTEVLNSNIANVNTHIVMQVGDQEKRLLALNHHFFKSLVKTHHKVSFTEYCGGHDQICWREGLVSFLLQYLTVPTLIANKRTTIL